MHTVIEILNLSTEYLKQKQILHPRRQAEELIGEALGLGRLGLYLEYNRPLHEDELEKCRQWLKRRGDGEPVQLIIGFVDFFNCRIKVNKEVLIPRQETEILVDKIVRELSMISLENKILWDVCCGSGCIGIALKKKFPSLHVVLSDICAKALQIAKENAKNNQVDVDFLNGDLLQPFKNQKAHYIVANPPYVSEEEYASLEKEVKEFEPKIALVSGNLGTEYYEKLAFDLSKFLNRPGKVWLEIGDGQGEKIKKLFESNFCWKHSEIELDWSGRQRFFSLEIE